MTASLSFEHILTPRGIERHKRLVLDGAGRITAIEDEAGDAFDGWLALPGLPNAHSHCFQRAMVGRGERAVGDDTFWSWRRAMYALAERIAPDDMYAIAARAFADMLRGGFTSVAEFHYLHHLPDGTPGPEMARAIVAAAGDAGIRLLLLPVLYQRGGFAQPARKEQTRFVHRRAEEFIALLETLKDVCRDVATGIYPDGSPAVSLGIGIHSLRAVAPETIAEVTTAADLVLGARCPRHIHIAEQAGEVEDCRAAHGAGPIELLGRHVDLDPMWNLVHATHASDLELDLMLRADASAVLCPLTEAYLGDGLFPARAFVAGGGRIAIGSDSNVRIDAVEELRMLEYGQRLAHRQRACLATDAGLGAPLWQRVADGGAAALDLRVGRIDAGAWADLVVLDERDTVLGGLAPACALDALVTAGSAAAFSCVYVGGRRLVTDGSHAGEPAIDANYRRTIEGLALQ